MICLIIEACWSLTNCQPLAHISWALCKSQAPFDIWNYSCRSQRHQTSELIIWVDIITLPITYRLVFFKIHIYISFCFIILFTTVSCKVNELTIYLLSKINNSHVSETLSLYGCLNYTHYSTYIFITDFLNIFILSTNLLSKKNFKKKKKEKKWKAEGKQKEKRRKKKEEKKKKKKEGKKKGKRRGKKKESRPALQAFVFFSLAMANRVLKFSVISLVAGN